MTMHEYRRTKAEHAIQVDARALAVLLPAVEGHATPALLALSAAPVGHITLFGARSRRDQRRFSRPNTHFAAFFKIYKNIIFSRANFANFCQQIAEI